MSHGPGKYDDECSAARFATRASVAILVIKDGIRGSGFSVQLTNLEDAHLLPSVLRQVADQIEHDNMS